MLESKEKADQDLYAKTGAQKCSASVKCLSVSTVACVSPMQGYSFSGVRCPIRPVLKDGSPVHANVTLQAISHSKCAWQ